MKLTNTIEDQEEGDLSDFRSEREIKSSNNHLLSIIIERNSATVEEFAFHIYPLLTRIVIEK